MDFERKFDQRVSSLVNLETETIAEVAAQFSTSPLRHSARLSGGFSNTNIVLDFADGERCVLRVSSQHERLEMEADLLAYLSHEAPAVESAWFADAYRAAGGHLDKTWREQSLFADLLAQCAFLINTEELPNTFTTAIGVIDRTLAVLEPNVRFRRKRPD